MIVHACMPPVSGGAGPTRALPTHLTLAPHTSSLQVRGRAEGPLPGAWGTSKATLNGLSSALSPSSCRSSGKSRGVSSPHSRVPPPPPQADGERDMSPGSSRFSAVLGLLCPRTGTRLLRSLPHFSTSQTAMQGGRPPAPVPPGTLGSGGHAWVGQSVAEPQSVWGRVLLGWVSKSEDLRAGCRV